VRTGWFFQRGKSKEKSGEIKNITRVKAIAKWNFCAFTILLLIGAKLLRYYSIFLSWLNFFVQGAVHKGRLQSGGEVVQCWHFMDKGGGGSSDVDVRTFWCKKHRIFWNLWRVRTDKGRRGPFFANLCGRPLWTAPNNKSTTWFFKHFIRNRVNVCELHLT